MFSGFNDLNQTFAALTSNLTLDSMQKDSDGEEKTDKKTDAIKISSKPDKKTDASKISSKSNNKNLEDELQELREKLKIKDAILNETQVRLDDRTKELENEKKLQTNAMKKLEKLEKKHTIQTDRYRQESSAKIVELEQIIDEKNKALDDRNNLISNLKAIGSESRINDKNVEMISNYHEKCEKMELLLNKAKERIESLKKKSESTKREFQEKYLECDRNRVELNNLLQESKLEIKELINNINIKEETIFELQNKLTNLQQYQDNLSTSNENVVDENHRKSEEIKSLLKQISTSKDELLVKYEEVQITSKDLAASKDELSHKKEEIKLLSDDLSKLREELLVKNGEVQLLTKALAIAKETCVKNENEIKCFNLENESLNKQMINKDEDILQLENKLKTLSEKTKDLIQRFNDQKSTFELQLDTKNQEFTKIVQSKVNTVFTFLTFKLKERFYYYYYFYYY
jgi:chromosome segregation ATPase